MRSFIKFIEVTKHDKGMDVLDKMIAGICKQTLPNIVDVLDELRDVTFKAIDVSDVTAYSYESYGASNWKIVQINTSNEILLAVTDLLDKDIDMKFKHGGDLFSPKESIQDIVVELLKDRVDMELNKFNMDMESRLVKLKTLVDSEITIHVTELKPFYDLVTTQVELVINICKMRNISNNSRFNYMEALHIDIKNALYKYKELKGNLPIDYDGDEDQVEKLMDDVIAASSALKPIWRE